MFSEGTQLKAFGRAVAFGTLAGAGLPLAVTLILALFSLQDVVAGQMPFYSALYLAILPLIVTFPIVLCASIVFGVPLTLFLKSRDSERLAIYCFAGAIIGFAIPIVILELIQAEAGYWMALLGAISGSVTAYTWWMGARLHLHQNADDPRSPIAED